MKIFTLNLNYYADKHGDWSQRKRLVAKVLREYAPDIVAFQAACSDPETDKGVNQASQLGELLPEYRYRHFFTAGRQPNGRLEGNALLSKIAPIETEQFPLSLMSGAEDPAQRLVAKSVFARGSDSFTLFIGHFSWVADQTENNVREAVGYLARANNCLLVGDLNADPKKDLLQPFKQAGYTDVWEKLKRDQDGFTFESNEPFTRIDYAWVDAGLVQVLQDIQVIKEEKDGVRMSDHFGLLLQLDI